MRFMPTPIPGMPQRFYPFTPLNVYRTYELLLADCMVTKIYCAKDVQSGFRQTIV